MLLMYGVCMVPIVYVEYYNAGTLATPLLGRCKTGYITVSINVIVCCAYCIFTQITIQVLITTL